MTEHPNPAVLAWASRTLGSPVDRVLRLAGGTHADTFLLGATASDREARVLTALDGLDGLAPVLLGADPDGSDIGRPGVLISRLRGGPDIAPAEPLKWAEQLGQTLARIHAVPLDRAAGFREVMDAQNAALEGPPAPVEDAWTRLASAPRVLTHFDFWSGNVLWDGPALCGVIDWSGAALAPRGFDVGWCRLDLVLLYDEETADAMLTGYEAGAGAPLPDRLLWDLHAVFRSERDVHKWVPNYRDLGRTDLDAAELRRRHTAWREALLAELSRSAGW